MDAETKKKILAARDAGAKYLASLKAFAMGELPARATGNVVTLMRKVDDLDRLYFADLLAPAKPKAEAK
jgi:hypothetical protein